MSSVVVLAPNGRRQTVKCTPNTTILQIIEEVCKKQELNPIQYDVKHHKKILDTTTSFRFSGLPNNAQLELVKASKSRTDGDITLAVNLENGTRVTETFMPNDTLLGVLNKICPDNVTPDKNPVVVYTRREIYGVELENCTLRSLGLTGGRAMIRVLNRDPQSLHEQANVSAPLPSKPVEEKPYIRKYQPIETNAEQTCNNTPKIDCADQNNGNSCGEHSTVDDTQSKTVIKEKNIKNTTQDILKLAKEKRKSEQGSVNQEVQKEKKKNIEKVDITNGVQEEVCPKIQRPIEEEFVFCGERNGMIFSLESAHSVPSEDLPDDFFELTIDDARKILRDVKRKRHEMENQLLRTSALRELEESKKQLRQLNKYKKTIIRVQFPDRTVVQGTFKPTETVQDVLDFVKSYIEDQNLDFYIYSTPPKSILKGENRLVEEGCVPGALLYFGCLEERKDGYLKKEFQNMLTSNSVASLAAHRIRQDNTRPTKEEEDHTDDVMDVAGCDPALAVNCGASTSSDATSSTMERKIVSSEKFPKWFKPM